MRISLNMQNNRKKYLKMIRKIKYTRYRDLFENLLKIE